MKKRTIAILAILAAMLAVVPAAAGGRGTVGGKLDLLGNCNEPMSYGENEAFHVIHGWKEEPPGYRSFRLYIDGAPIRGGLRFPSVDNSTRPVTHGVLVLYNFPSGMPAGTYTFRGEWLSRVKGDLTRFACTSEVTFD
jgi:hypothetical protein